MEELVFWQSNLGHFSGRRIRFKSSEVRVAFSGTSDTGLLSWGVRRSFKVVGLPFQQWEVLRCVRVRKVLQSFALKFAGLCGKWHTDNQNVAHIQYCRRQSEV